MTEPNSEIVALVTGASRGIGKAILEDLSKMGYTVIGTATSATGAESITDYIKQLGGKGGGVELNISSPESIDSCMATIKQEWAMPLVVVNNAGITKDNIMLRMKADQWDDVISTNLTGSFRVIKACMKAMFKARWGRIINISSVSGVMGNVGQANYAAAKAGLIGMTKSIAIEMASFGITANCVAPGFTQTDMVAAMEEGQKELISQHVPMKRMATPQEVAFAVAMLADKRASYITGETIQVNGGLLMQ